MFYCKARRKRLEQKEFKGKQKTSLSEKKIKIKTALKGNFLGESLRLYTWIQRKQLLDLCRITAFWTLLLQIYYLKSWRRLCPKQPLMWGLDWILNVLSFILRHWWTLDQSVSKWSFLSLLTLSTWRSWKLSSTKEAPHCKTNVLRQHPRKCIENSLERIHLFLHLQERKL